VGGDLGNRGQPWLWHGDSLSSSAVVPRGSSPIEQGAADPPPSLASPLLLLRFHGRRIRRIHASPPTPSADKIWGGAGRDGEEQRVMDGSARGGGAGMGWPLTSATRQRWCGPSLTLPLLMRGVARRGEVALPWAMRAAARCEQGGMAGSGGATL
jgi:hypothetical protein